MPYIITTTPGPDTLHLYETRADQVIAEGTRRAVATLAEARTFVADQYPHYGDAAEREVDDALTREGGTVGPLPDGTVIEVERQTWRRLEALAGMRDTDHDADDTGAILDAYNAQQ